MAGTWTNWINRDQPSGSADNENAHKMNLCNGNEATSIEARVASTQEDYSTTGQIVSITPVDGFKCLNADQLNQNCHDYEVRFCCPTKLTDWSDWTDCNKSCGVGEQTRQRFCSGECSHLQASDLNETQICKQGNYLRLTSSADSGLCQKDENESVSDWAGGDIQVCLSANIKNNCLICS